MNDKINLQDLIDLLEKQANMEQVDVAAFVRAFWETIEEGLLHDGIVKVKGLGTFKLVGVESRESINVNTGERFEIQQHSKITFMADSSMRNIINKPFAHFESVILNENTTFDDIEESVVGEADTGNEADDTVEVPVETVAVSEASETPVPDESAEPVSAEVPLPEPLPDESSEKESEENEKSEENGEAVAAEIPAEEPNPADSIEESVEEEVTEPLTVMEEEVADEETPLSVEETLQVDTEDTESAPEETKIKMEADAEEQSGEAEEPVGDAAQPAEESVPEEDIPAETTEETGSREEESPAEVEAEADPHTAVNDKLRSMDIYQQPPVYEDEKTSRRPLTGRKLLFIAIVVVFVFVALANLISWLRMNQEEEPKASQEVTSTIQSVQPEVESEEELVAENVIQQTPVKETPQKSQVKEVQKEEQKKNVAAEPAKKASAASTPQALVTHVKGKETVADTVEYAMVGVLAHDTIRPGDTLAKLSFKYYGNRRLWQYIAAYNKSVVKNPNNVPIGTALAIPKLKERK